MLTYFEDRRRAGSPLFGPGDLYKVQSWYLLGFILVYRRWTQLTCSGDKALGSELK